jgi:hypothetical protein
MPWRRVRQVRRVYLEFVAGGVVPFWPSLFEIVCPEIFEDFLKGLAGDSVSIINGYPECSRVANSG